MSNRLSTGFHAIHANHLEDLRRAVVFICRNNPLGPLDNEVFLVQSNGIAQWLKMALAQNPSGTDDGGGLGIAAGMEFLFPARFIWQAYRAVLPEGEVPLQSPFDKQRLTWRLYRLWPELSFATHSIFQPLECFLKGSEPEIRRFQLAEKIADLFDQYQVFRADWLSGWEQGQNSILTARGQIQELEPENLWQAHLWRRVVEDIQPEPNTSRAQIHTRFMQEGRVGQEPANPQRLPKRIIVFGISSMPQQELEALSVLSRFCQVVLCVHNPCQYYWADIVSDRELLRAERKRGQLHPVLSEAEEPDLLHQHANPLLAAWGKQGRDYIRLLDQFDDPDAYRLAFEHQQQKIDIFAEHGDIEQPTLLHQLQNDILNLMPAAEIQQDLRQVQPDHDQSIVFHQAHSPLREVEILHDQLLAAFHLNPDLRPHDVMVMLPDINSYTAHIKAVFGRYERGSDRYIPFTLSDQGQRFHEPLLIALETLLTLPDSRFAVSTLLSLLEVPELRERFAMAEADMPVLQRWVEGANIRWGLHEQQREFLNLPDGLQRNTWQSGLRAMLLGYAMGPDESWQGIETYGEVAGLEAQLAGKLAEFMRYIEQLWQQLKSDHQPFAWVELLNDLLEQFFIVTEPRSVLLIHRFKKQIEQWLETVRAAGLEHHEIPRVIIKDELLSGLDEGGLNQRFMAGKVNFATLMPMRAIPFRRICLLGMNDGDYPRSRPPVDFDLMARDYRPGDRSRREDDRYLFLEALLSAREQLYISWVGRSIRDDSVRPASVLVGQLRDHIDRLWQLPPEFKGEVTNALTTEHPLQPFSRGYFPQIDSHDPMAETRMPEPEILRPKRLFTFEWEWRGAHQTQDLAPRSSLPYSAPEDALTLKDLATFLKKPIETFYQRRLQVYFDSISVEETDYETFDLSGLKRWQLDHELIQKTVIKAISEQDFEQRLEAVLNQMARRGDLGMGLTEQHLRHVLQERLPNLYQRYGRALQNWPIPVTEPLMFNYAYQSLQVSDLITSLRRNPQGECCRLVLASSGLLSGSGNNKQVRYANLLNDWVIHLAGQLTEQSFETLILAKEEDRQFVFPRLEPSLAERYLQAIMDQWMQGTQEPLPLHSEAGFAWIKSYYKSKQAGDEGAALRKAEEEYAKKLAVDMGYLRGAFSSAEELFADGRFIELTQLLYGPLWCVEQGLSEDALC